MIFVRCTSEPITLIQAGIQMFKVNNRNSGTRCEIYSGVFIVNFEHIPHLAVVFLLLTLNM